MVTEDDEDQPSSAPSFLRELRRVMNTPILGRGGQPREGEGWTPLHQAAAAGQTATAARLLDGGADVNARDGLGRTPLHVAIANGSQAVAALLLRRGADLNSSDSMGRTPWATAVECGNTEMASALREYESGRPPAAIFPGGSNDETPRADAPAALADSQRSETYGDAVAKAIQEIFAGFAGHVYLFDGEGRFIYANQAAIRDLRLAPRHVIGQTWQEIGLSAKVMKPLEAGRQAVAATGQPHTGKVKMLGVDGEKAFEYMLGPASAAGAGAVLAVLWDVTHFSAERERLERARHDAEAKAAERVREMQHALEQLHFEIGARKTVLSILQDERDFLASVLNGVGALVVVLDREGRIIRFNHACVQLTGYTLDEVSDRPFWDLLLLPEDAETAKATFAGLTAENFPRVYEQHWIARDGSRRLIAWIDAAILDDEGAVRHVVATGMDVTESKRMRDALAQHAELPSLILRDELTGLHNRRGFFTLAEYQLKLAARAGERLLLLYVDIDALRTINESSGRHEGDRAIVDVAKALSDAFPESDLIARIGGDEFAVLTHSADVNAANVIAKRWKSRLEEHKRASRRAYHLSASLSHAVFDPAQPCSLEELLMHASQAMSRLKPG